MRIKNERAADGEVLVAVDHNIETVDTVRGNDSTKVLVEEGRILDIGKNIKKYNVMPMIREFFFALQRYLPPWRKVYSRKCQEDSCPH